MEIFTLDLPRVPVHHMVHMAQAERNRCRLTGARGAGSLATGTTVVLERMRRDDAGRWDEGRVLTVRFSDV
jgi:hypothetical protein